MWVLVEMHTRELRVHPEMLVLGERPWSWERDLRLGKALVGDSRTQGQVLGQNH